MPEIYTNLDYEKRQIRLLRLLPGKRPAQPECQLFSMSLNSCDAFEALSYVWGDLNDTRPVTMEGITIPVTKNLYEALLQLRCEDRPRILWIDALCINQDNLKERNHQVQLMRDIYSAADRVIAWLGPADPDDGGVRKAVETISLLGSDPNLHWTDEKLAFDIVAFWKFLSNPWWQRVWTAQEAVLAKTLVYVRGTHEIPDKIMNGMVLSYIIHANTWFCCDVSQADKQAAAFVDFSGSLRLLLTQVNHLRELRDTQHHLIPFLEVSTMLATRNATDPRDIIFGFLGISTGIGTDIVDYTIAVDKVFERVVRQLIVSSGNLDVLCTTYGGSRESEWDLPSWVTDWTCRSTVRVPWAMAMNYRMSFYNGWEAAGNSRAQIYRKDVPGKLTLRGFAHDVVEQIDTSTSTHSWRRMAGVDQDPDRAYAAGGSCLDAFWRTLCLDISIMAGRAGEFKRATEEDRVWHDQWWFEKLLERHQVKHHIQDRKTRSLDFDAHVTSSTAHRCFFITKKGYFGLGYSTTRVGDEVFILAGGRMPFLLREQQPVRKSWFKGRCRVKEYLFVGDAYVHGIMHGEAMEGNAKFKKLVLGRGPLKHPGSGIFSFSHAD